MDPHLLRTFVAVAECGSFSAAARQLRYTQSAVSQQIAVLEEQLGRVLLNRRPVAPTEAGARLLEHAAAILLRIEAARADVSRVSGGPAGELVLGASPLALTSQVAAALASLRRRLPRLALTIRIMGREPVGTAVATGALELGLADGVVAPNDPLRLPEVAGLRAFGLSQQPLLVVLPTGHPLAERPGLGLAELTDAGWIDAPEVAPLLADLRRAAGTDGLRPGLRYQGTDLAGLSALVAAGHGLVVLPAGRPLPVGLVGVPLATPSLVHRIELWQVHSGSTLARNLREELLRECGGDVARRGAERVGRSAIRQPDRG